MPGLPEASINERAQHFLRVLIERYIRDGQPVGSRTLAKDSGLDLSPATIRNVMADLEDAGLIVSPHTSAGRIPTANGYRMFVDSLIASQNVDQKLLSSISQEFQVSDKKGSDIIHSTSELLSNMTHLAGVVMVPKRNSETIRQIEFVPLSGTRVLTVIVTSAGEILNRLIETSREFTRSELEQFSKIVTQQYANTHLEGVRTRVFEQMQADRQHMDKLMADALSMAEQAFGSSDDVPADMIVSGQTNLMDFDELAQMDRLRGLFNAFTEKQEILHLLDRALDADGLQIFIGEESGYTTLRDCSVITAPYEVDNEVIGVLGVIGPTRINYDRVIPIVDITAKLFGAALKTR